MLKLLLAGALVLAPSSVAPETPAHQQDKIPLVYCPQGNGWVAGSAFRVGPHLLLSVKHVTNEKNCHIDGQPIDIAYTSPKADFSILADDRSGPALKVDCAGFIKGRHYVAIGHARGLPRLTAIDLTGTGEFAQGQAVLVGIATVIPGQSGGAIIDAETGAVVGTINRYQMDDGLSLSVELRGTSICGGTLA